ncbi:MAG: hypothetical protein LBK06_08705 [Planctomycetaceae bacterium]|jgi:hypothetical protein|nr:hypothetical protein [Planctomycetaceae bacterium]
MANWITITWESDRLRLLGARVQSGTVVFEHAAQFALQKNENGSTVKDQLLQFLQKHRLTKSETIVLLNRSDVEVRPMLFPPVPTDELCDLVRFQAVKEFNAYDQSSPLDFFVTNKFANISRSALFPSVFHTTGRHNNANRETTNNETKKISTPSGSPVHLLASTIRRELFQKIGKFCEEAGLNLRHILLRPCESAYLWKFSGEFNPTRTILLLELDEEEITQTVLHNGEPVFIRSPKIISPEDVSNPDFVAVLSVELRRTMIAVRNEIQGVTVDDIVVCGKNSTASNFKIPEAEHDKQNIAERLAQGQNLPVAASRFADLSKQISDALGVPVKMFDAWSDPKLSGSKIRIARGGDLVKTSDKLQNDLTAGNIQNPERYTALIGSLLRIGNNAPNDIDFCNPKKRQERIGYRVFANLAIVAVFLLLVGWVGYEFYTQYSLFVNNKALSNKEYQLKQTAKSVAPSRLQLQEIEDWHDDKIDWFEQLGWLSRNAPKSQDMMLTALTLAAPKKKSGSKVLMDLTAVVRDSSIVPPMEENFRTENHDVRTGDKSEMHDNSQYRYQVILGIYLKEPDSTLFSDDDEPTPQPPKNSTENSTENKNLPETNNKENENKEQPINTTPANPPENK